MGRLAISDSSIPLPFGRIIICHETHCDRPKDRVWAAGCDQRRRVYRGAIAERIDAKEAVEELAADYGVTTTEIEQAVLFERAA